jgi:phosphinothricin acetyltransferase
MTLSIRAASPSDAPSIQAIYAPIIRDTAISFETDVPSVQEMARRIETILKSHAYLVAENAGQVAGYAYASPHRTRAAYQTSVDVTVYVAETARSAGVGKALYGALLPKVAGLGYHAAFAGITMPNEGSVALHESVGFTAVGIYQEVGRKFDRWHDVGWWQRVLSDKN